MVLSKYWKNLQRETINNILKHFLYLFQYWNTSCNICQLKSIEKYSSTGNHLRCSFLNSIQTSWNFPLVQDINRNQLNIILYKVSKHFQQDIKTLWTKTLSIGYQNTVNRILIHQYRLKILQLQIEWGRKSRTLKPLISLKIECPKPNDLKPLVSNPPP